jgi:hypothetical protein
MPRPQKEQAALASDSQCQHFILQTVLVRPLWGQQNISARIGKGKTAKPSAAISDL